jgi:hypothetical protein
VDSPRNPPRNKDGTPSCLGVALGHRWEEIGRRSPNAGRKRSRGINTQGTRLVQYGPDYR